MHEAEIKARFGQTILGKMKADYKDGFHIVGETGKSIMIGNGYKSTEYSRKTGRVLGSSSHKTRGSIKRKAG